MAFKALNMNKVHDRYPRSVRRDGADLEITHMTREHGTAVSAFVATLPAHDLLFLRRDISNPKVLAAWLDAIDRGEIASLVLRQGDAVVGCTAIATDPLSWSAHVGELRVLLSPALRGKGLGQTLVQECFALALGLGLSKLCVQMTIDQRAAIAAFEGLGFRPEALLRNHVRDRNGVSHDLALLSHDVDAVQSKMHAYGVADAFGGE